MFSARHSIQVNNCVEVGDLPRLGNVVEERVDCDVDGSGKILLVVNGQERVHGQDGRARRSARVSLKGKSEVRF